MALPMNTPLNNVYLTAHLADISAASSTFVACPVRAQIIKAYSTIHGAITGADCTWSLEVNDTAVTGSTVTIANSGSAAGDVDETGDLAGSTTFVNPGDRIEFKSAGESSTTALATFTVVLRIV